MLNSQNSALVLMKRHFIVQKSAGDKAGSLSFTITALLSKILAVFRFYLIAFSSINYT